MGMGFGQGMPGTPMVIMWSNSNGSITLSQRQASGYIMPTVVSSPPRVATLSAALSTTSGNSAFVYTIPANSDTKQNVIYGFGTTNPGSPDEDATLQQHLDSGSFQLDLTKSLSSTATGSGAASTSTSGGDTSSDPTDDIPFTPQQRMILAHAIFCVIGFALLLPVGVMVARYLRTFTPTWYTGHWIAQFALSGPVILIGVVLGFQSAGKFGYTLWDDHKKTGVVVFALYLAQCVVGAFIHYVKPKHSTKRPFQNYFHAVFGLAIIGLGLYQIRTGYKKEWPMYISLHPIPMGVNILWMVWVILLPVMYAAGLLLFLRKQYAQEEASRKGWGSNSNNNSNDNIIMSDRYHDQ
ncbi:hypothetical protein FB451DRAFT_1259939 [Mycena latifolia]|nr:hypothetical protein FB451DRAFT_1259939 [Mycena latifolia]